MAYNPPRFSEERLAQVRKIVGQFPEGRQKGALIRVLHMAQEDFGGHLTAEVMDYVADLLAISPIEVYEVATFYTMFNLKPVGKYMLEVCHTGPCMLRGADKTIAYLQQKLGIKVNETTEDGFFTLKSAECLGACGYAPMMQCGEHYYENLTEEKIDALVDAWQKQPVPPKAWEKID
ncbi:MAG TPA: NAD(P)H-dependent oxidoreductase subunit E [Bacteroidetes bacterium]|nr:NAD(P)H-dependent oxidoreductase subunit E [Bacteroidota bacterium]